MGKQKSFENEEEDEEALSLSDLPNKTEEKDSPVFGKREELGTEEFDFCSWGGSNKESEMCVADELFFQGQILPLRNSVGSDGNSAGIRCNSMDRSHSIGYTSGSSRSSSTRSHQSSSASSANSSGATPQCRKNRRIRNQFQFSQPSPTPQIRSSKVSHGQNVNNYPQNSTLWSLFRVGLVTMPEIGSQNFRTRNREPDNNSNNNHRSKNNVQRFVDKNLAFFDTCKCSVDSVDTVRLKSTKGEDERRNNKEQLVSRKQTISRIRTFEWLKELSIEGERSHHRVDS